MQRSTLIRSKLMAATLATLALSCALAQTTQASVIYRETFGAANNDAAPSTVGWFANVTTLGTVSNSTALIGTGQNGSGALTNVNAGGQANTPQANNGFGVIYMFHPTNTPPTPPNRVLMWTNEYLVDRELNSITSIQYQQGNSANADATRVAIRIDSNWYVSTTETRNTGYENAFANNALNVTLPFSTAASAWSNLTLNPGTSLAIGLALSNPLPTGNITAFGLYTDSVTRTVRFDTFTINANPIPEPTAFAALSAAVLVVLRRRREM